MKLLKILAPITLGVFVFSLLVSPVSAQGPWSTAAFQSWRQGVTASGRMGVPRLATASLPTCNASNLGAVFGDTTSGTMKYCDGTGYDEMGTFTGGSVANPITGPDGTAAAPGFAFTTDADGTGTGMFLRASAVLGIATNGTEILEITNSGGAIVRVASGTQFVWGATTVISAPDIGLERVAAGALAPTDGSTGTGKIAYTQQSVTVNGATTFAANSNYVLLACTGAETINTITGGVQGMVLWIENSDSECTIADDDDPTAADAIDLTGAAGNDVGAVSKVITLIYNGTSWDQVAESDN